MFQILKNKKTSITYQQLKETLFYNKETGIFTWKIKRKGIKKSIAGYKDSQGYIIITIKKKRYKASRLAWLYVYGYFPENPIDHINQIRSDNRIKNLRVVSFQCNMRNRKVGKNNKTGISGICCETKGKGWRVFIYVNKKCKNLGTYEDFDEAVCARLEAEQCLDWNKCLSNSSAYQYVQKILKNKVYSEPRNIVKDVKKRKEVLSHKEHKKTLNAKRKK